MLLNAEQILAARPLHTREVDVPEWGTSTSDPAKVLVGPMGGLARVRFVDWLDGLGRVPEPAPEDEDAVVTCDSEPEPSPRSDAARIEQLESTLRYLLQAVTDTDAPEDLGKATEAAEEILESTGPEKVYTKEEDYRITLRWCVECILKPDGSGPAFSLEQIEALGRLDPAPLYRIAAAARDLNLATQAAATDFEKNSARTPDSVSGGA